MEHYHKVSSQLIEKSQLPNELRIGPTSGRSNLLVEKAFSILNEHPSEGLIISSCGTYVTQAVGVIEQLKKQNDILQASFELYYVRVEDIWAPDQPGLDILKVKRRIPALQARLLCDQEKQVKASTIQPVSMSASPPTGGSTNKSNSSRKKRKDKSKDNK
ncbi:PREDICTED: uncharacterized protein LOC109581504 [Amphimedon queenslandica]|uniref:DNA/RNA-binding protein Alba-like domain-containing protein n=1 Tax=Amphimedon queenslandica TaxID=400682 RepID=A0A1X7V0M2_AMPQE|nr:PREDICTED: uncharacterized protein LOC109581504 [Amphimedon queenslandica]|eukprot:XP_019851215.1 PREDICTED: uncharacterized protein LOC109581504 [Amphimedon queenslandica]